MPTHYEFGKQSEREAKEYLIGKGYDILETNWIKRKKEIDIIAKQNDVLVIVEVKSRKTDFFGEPYLAVNKKKRKHLIEATNAYVKKNDLSYDIRFDIISILQTETSMKINHIENAFCVHEG